MTIPNIRQKIPIFHHHDNDLTSSTVAMYAAARVRNFSVQANLKQVLKLQDKVQQLQHEVQELMRKTMQMSFCLDDTFPKSVRLAVQRESVV